MATVSEGSQEMFLEYAHYLPERAVLTVVAKLRELVADELNGRDLKSALDSDAVLEHTTRINEGDPSQCADCPIDWPHSLLLELKLRASTSGFCQDTLEDVISGGYCM